MKERKRIFRAIGMITQIGISMMVPIFLCIFVGYQLDQRLKTSYWVLIFMFLGIMTSFRNVYYMTKSFYAKDKAREEAEMNYFANLRQNNLERMQNDSSKRKGHTDEKKNK